MLLQSVKGGLCCPIQDCNWRMGNTDGVSRLRANSVECSQIGWGLFVSNPSIRNHNSPSFCNLLNVGRCTKIIDVAISDSKMCIASCDSVLMYSLKAIDPINQAQHTSPLKVQRIRL